MRDFLIVACVVLMSALPALAGDTNIPGRLIVQDGKDAPTCSTASGAGMLCVEQAAELQSTLAVAGAATLTGAVTASSTLAANGTITMGSGADVNVNGNELYGQLTFFDDKTTNYTVDGDDCGRVLATNDPNRVFTLPAVGAGNLGCRVSFVVTAADDGAQVSISPNASDAIYGVCCGVNDAASTTCVGLSGTDDKDLRVPETEQDKGDSVTLVSDGSTGWFTLGCVGAGWVSES